MRECTDSAAEHRRRPEALYQDGHDASRALILIEYPSAAAHDGVDEWHASFAHCLDLDGAEEHVWECIERGD